MTDNKGLLVILISAVLLSLCVLYGLVLDLNSGGNALDVCVKVEAGVVTEISVDHNFIRREILCYYDGLNNAEIQVDSIGVIIYD
jgi:hypothetical protein